MAEVSVADQLKILIELQKLDAQIFQLRRDKEAKPEQAEALKAEHQQAVETGQTAEGAYKSLEVNRKEKENDLAEKETQIKKLQGQLFQLKTNKEYTAMQKEIEGLKADKSVLEEEILKLMEQTDQAKESVHSEQDDLKAQENDLKAQLSRLEEEGRKIEGEMAQLESARQELAPKVDPKILAQYEQILERKEGIALVPVQGDACGGCFLNLPPQMINEIQLATRVILCGSCARILYYESSS